MKPVCTRFITFIGLAVLSINAEAQQRKPPESPARPALAVINNPSTSLSGEVTVMVRGDENPIIRLQMVPNGQTLVEFPAKDRIFRVNPADPDLVTIEDSPTKETDRSILLRSGRQFLPGSTGTSMIVQMTSGMVITLLIHPVRELEQMAHRCVVRYDREAIISMRQAAGLAVHLDERQESGPKAVTASSSSIQMASPQKPVTEEAGQVAAATAASMRVLSAAKKSGVTETGKSPERIVPDKWEGWDATNLKWTKPRHGLRAAAQLITLSNGQRLVRVWVRNELAGPLKVAPGYPDLSVHTADERGRLLQVEPLKNVRTESTGTNEMILAGQTVRYLLTYEVPVLSAKQKLMLSVGQSNAADEPLVIELTTGGR